MPSTASNRRAGTVGGSSGRVPVPGEWLLAEEPLAPSADVRKRPDF